MSQRVPCSWQPAGGERLRRDLAKRDRGGGPDISMVAGRNLTIESASNSSVQASTQANSVEPGRSANQNDVIYNNTHVGGGNAVNIVAGGDLTLTGADVEANRVEADVGGNQHREPSRCKRGSNPSVEHRRERQPLYPTDLLRRSTVGGNAAKANTHGVYASVNEQSGIKAGDGGFNVNVKNNTDLSGGIVSGTQLAVDAGLDSLHTGTLTIGDLVNRSTGLASSLGVGHDSDTPSQGGYGLATTVTD